MLDKVLLWLSFPSEPLILSCRQPHDCRYLTGFRKLVIDALRISPRWGFSCEFVNSDTDFSPRSWGTLASRIVAAGLETLLWQTISSQLVVTPRLPIVSPTCLCQWLGCYVLATAPQLKHGEGQHRLVQLFPCWTPEIWKAGT